MNRFSRNAIVVGVFVAIAIFGILLSRSAPYIPDGDEVVYLAGTEEVQKGDLPDAYMLQAFDQRPYLYPQIMSWWYEDLGYYDFKSIYLFLLVLAVGISAYAMFGMLGLPPAPALLFAVVAMLPRYSAGLEIFGVLTFKEAIGREMALPLFFLGSGFLLRRVAQKKSTWPLFAAFGLCVFLHPVTVMLFAFISLVALFVVRLFQKRGLRKALSEIVLSGIAFVVAGSYFFIEVLQRLGHGVADTGTSISAYVNGILLRNPWEFPPASTAWFTHMAIVSVFFVALLVAFYFLPALRFLRARYPAPHARDILIWGLTIAFGSIALCVLIPTGNLYAMEHWGAPYIFQQWSRISKFYYLGLFIALVPTVYALWGWYKETTWRWKRWAVAVLFVGGILSSSFAFEVAQFVVGYKNFEPAYIPQALSHIANGITEAEYRQTCAALGALGATSQTLVISGDFSLRYYCKADLYVTEEEGGAYQQLLRSDVVTWYDDYRAQKTALGSGDPKQITVFAKNIGASFIVLSNNPKNLSLAMSFSGARVATTTRQVIIKLKQ